ncbi:MAG: hypothetical protein A2341_00310 [Deltaproteobacteria bacterium RIFOXYB12_FULL_58_9]|nr:MAG: hypothetical protein A2341_00310 [Deltaproteobacteria bacterium RIFOXYB12_FULL_58_9]
MDAHSVDTLHTELTDALARGRLAPAEIAHITASELDAVFELAAQCLDARRDNEATALLGGVVTLYPFSARYWRAYGIALHRGLEIDRARAAYDTALALDPNHDLTLCYRAELLIYSGKRRRAEADLLKVAKGGSAAAVRAQQLLAQLKKLARWQAPTVSTPSSAQEEITQVMPLTVDGQHLPLEPSRFVNERDLPTAIDEITQTMRVFTPLEPESTASSHATVTALLPNPECRAESTETAILPGRGRHPAPSPDTSGTIAGETTRTAIVMRRSAVLDHEDTELIDGRER